MNIQKASCEYLNKTYCHLKNNVLISNQENRDKFPITGDGLSVDGPWDKIEREVCSAMTAIKTDLSHRGSPDPHC